MSVPQKGNNPCCEDKLAAVKELIGSFSNYDSAEIHVVKVDTSFRLHDEKKVSRKNNLTQVVNPVGKKLKPLEILQTYQNQPVCREVTKKRERGMKYEVLLHFKIITLFFVYAT